MPTRVYSVSNKPNQSALKNNAKLLAAVLIAAGILGGVGYDRMLLPETPVQATVTEEVHFEMFSGGKADAKNIVTLQLNTGPDAGKEAIARYHFSTNAKNLKKGEPVVGLLTTSRILGKRVVSDVEPAPKILQGKTP